MNVKVSTVKFEGGPLPKSLFLIIILAIFICAELPLRAHAAVIYSSTPDISTTPDTFAGIANFTVASTATFGGFKAYVWNYSPDPTGDFYVQDESLGSPIGCTSASMAASAFGAGATPYGALVTVTGFTGTCSLNSSDTYSVRFTGGNVDFGKDSSSGVVMVEIADAGGFTSDTTTHISSVIPANNATVSTTTSRTLEITGYISTSTIAAGSTVISVEMSNTASRVALTANALSAFFAAFGGSDQTSIDRTFSFEATTSGAFDVSTTTDLSEVGQYSLYTAITTTESSFFGLFSSSVVQASTSTKFLAATSSVYDSMVEQSGVTGSIFQQAVTDQADSCVSIVSTFNACFFALFVPDQADFTSLFQEFHDDIGDRVPFGYITRFYDIFLGASSTAPVEPPALVYTFGSSSPSVLQGDTVSIQIWDYLSASTSPLLLARADDGSNKDIWDIVDPYFAMVVAFSVFLVIIGDLLGIFFNEDQWQAQETESTTVSTAYGKGGEKKPVIIRHTSTRSRRRKLKKY